MVGQMLKNFISYVVMVSMVVTNSYAFNSSHFENAVSMHTQEQYGIAFGELQTFARTLNDKNTFVREVLKHFPENSLARDKFLESVNELKESPFKETSFTPTQNGGEIQMMKQTLRVDFDKEVIVIQNKEYSFKNTSPEEIFSQWYKDFDAKKTTSYSFSIIEDAHAVLPLVYVAIVVVVAAGVVVTKVAASSINHYRNLSCERKVQIFISSLQSRTNTCELNLNQVASSPSLLAKALRFKKNYQGKPQDICKESIINHKEFMKKDVLKAPVTCVTDEVAEEACKKLKAVEACQGASAKAVNNSDRSIAHKAGATVRPTKAPQRKVSRQ